MWGKKRKKLPGEGETKREEGEIKKEKGDPIADIVGTFTLTEESNKGDDPKPNDKGGKKTVDIESGKKVGNGGGILEDYEACSISYKARLIGFAICTLLTILCLAGAYLAIVLLHRLPLFALLYSLASLLAIGSTAFLVGPMRQFRVMMQKGRVVATIIYLVAIVATVVVAIKGILVGVIVGMIVQVLAFLFYSLTFMPFVGLWIRRRCSISGV